MTVAQQAAITALQAAGASAYLIELARREFEIAAPVPVPPPPVPPPPSTAYTNAQINALAKAAGYAGAIVIRVTVPEIGLAPKQYTRGFRNDMVVVVVFTAPPPDEAFSVSIVQTGAAVTGLRRTRDVALAATPCEFAGPSVVFAGRGSAMGVVLASGTTPSPRSPYLLTPGREYFLNVSNRPYEPADAAKVFDIIIAISNPKP